MPSGEDKGERAVGCVEITRVQVEPPHARQRVHFETLVRNGASALGGQMQCLAGLLFTTGGGEKSADIVEGEGRGALIYRRRDLERAALKAHRLLAVATAICNPGKVPQPAEENPSFSSRLGDATDWKPCWR